MFEFGVNLWIFIEELKINFLTLLKYKIFNFFGTLFIQVKEIWLSCLKATIDKEFQKQKIKERKNMTQLSSINEPAVSITRNKNQLKIYQNNTVYLNNGENFEILVFNSLQERIGFEVLLNGRKISNSLLILNPGEKVYLERFIDDNKKFLFETYQVDNTEEVKNAIKKNGNLELKFFKEQVFAMTPAWNYQKTLNGLGFNDSGTATDGLNWYNQQISGVINTTYCNFSNNTTFDDTLMETGRISEGSQSIQNFETTNFNQQIMTFYSVSFKLLPQSTMNVNEIRKYCSECGVRIRKNNYKFCPICGNKL